MPVLSFQPQLACSNAGAFLCCGPRFGSQASQGRAGGVQVLRWVLWCQSFSRPESISALPRGLMGGSQGLQFHLSSSSGFWALPAGKLGRMAGQRIGFPLIPGPYSVAGTAGQELCGRSRSLPSCGQPGGHWECWAALFPAEPPDFPAPWPVCSWTLFSDPWPNQASGRASPGVSPVTLLLFQELL